MRPARKIYEFSAQCGARIRAIREAQCRTQEHVAAAAGFTEQYLSRIERGETNIPTETLWQTAQALGVSPSSFFDDMLCNIAMYEVKWQAWSQERLECAERLSELADYFRRLEGSLPSWRCPSGVPASGDPDAQADTEGITPLEQSDEKTDSHKWTRADIYGHTRPNGDSFNYVEVGMSGHERTFPDTCGHPLVSLACPQERRRRCPGSPNG